MLAYHPIGMLQANCYLFACDITKKGVLIDPGDGAAELLRWIEKFGVEIEYILLTHGHMDHIGAVEELRGRLKAKVAIHQADAEMLINSQANLSSAFSMPIVNGAADVLLTDGQIITIGQERIQVLATPGHTTGGVCYLTSAGLFSGDTLFSGAVGRTDFPGGSHAQLIKSIKEKLFVLPDETTIYPGHGLISTIGLEKKDNPFFQH